MRVRGSDPALEIHLFGGLQVSLHNEPIGGQVASKGLGLLAFLAVERDRPHRRELLAEMLWPGRPEGTARNNLRQALLGLRSALGDQESRSPYLLAEIDQLQFNPRSSFSLDTLEFEQLVDVSLEHRHARGGACRSCRERLRRAIELYTEDFLINASLPDLPDFDDWVVIKREALRRRLAEALRSLIQLHEMDQEYVVAARYARRLVEREPWDEANHRILMRMLALAGWRSAALKQYQECRRVIRAEFDAEPSKRTEELHTAIRDDSVVSDFEGAERGLSLLAGSQVMAIDSGGALVSSSLRGRRWQLSGAIALLCGAVLLLVAGSYLREVDRFWRGEALAASRASLNSKPAVESPQSTETAPTTNAADHVQQGDPASVDLRYRTFIVGSPTGDFLWTSNFSAGGMVSAAVYQTRNPGADLLCEGAFRADEHGFINVHSANLAFNLVPGNLLVVADDRSEDSLVLEDITFDLFDTERDLVAGRAPPARGLLLVIATGPQSHQQTSFGLMADAVTGAWGLELEVVGLDLTEEMRPHSFAQVFDADGDATEAVPPGMGDADGDLASPGYCFQDRFYSVH